MFWQKACDQGPAILDPASTWGRFTRYLEIGDDLFVVRHVDVFENGNALRYDRRHWDDDFGMLADMHYSKRWDKYWGPAVSIERPEFDEIWQKTENGAIWPLQCTSARMSRDRKVPPWVTIAGVEPNKESP
jgi:hypothetical protein